MYVGKQKCTLESTSFWYPQLTRLEGWSCKFAEESVSWNQDHEFWNGASLVGTIVFQTTWLYLLVTTPKCFLKLLLCTH